jgi:DNA polymerase-4
LDVTDSVRNFGTGEEIAEKIRQAVKEEIGVTVSIGVSYNKIFAKLGSDMKKPDAITVITPENYKQTVWELPVSDLLYVGRSTEKKLNSIGVHTIGDLANTDEKVLTTLLGVWGKTLHVYANGEDQTAVVDKYSESTVKSISNSMTDYKDLITLEEVKTLILLLSETVASRLRASGLGKATTVKLSITDNELNTFGKQTKFEIPTHSSVTIAEYCYKLFESLYKWERPVRGIGVAVSDFTLGEEQLSLLFDGKKNKKIDDLDEAVDKIRQKYGNTSVQRARILIDEKLARMDLGREEIKPFDKGGV